MNEFDKGLVIVRDHDVIALRAFFPRRSVEWKWESPPIPKWKRDFWRKHGFAVESVRICVNGRCTPPWPRGQLMPEKYMREVTRPRGVSQSHWRKIRKQRG